MLTNFISTVNGKGGTKLVNSFHDTSSRNMILCPLGSSHLVTISCGPVLSDALLSSPILASEDGSTPAALGGGLGVGGMAGFEFGIDPNEDPELALVSYSMKGTRITPVIYMPLLLCLFV